MSWLSQGYFIIFEGYSAVPRVFGHDLCVYHQFFSQFGEKRTNHVQILLARHYITIHIDTDWIVYRAI
jgi:hypothetical protein